MLFNYDKSLSSFIRMEYGFFQFLDHFFGRKTANRISLGGRQSMYREIDRQLKKNGKKPIVPLKKVKDISLEDFQKNHLKKGIPIVFEGAAKDWECCKSWDLEFFNQKHGDERVVLLANSGENTNVLDEAYESTTFSDIISNIRTGGTKYLNFYPLLDKHPEYYKDFDIQWLKERRHQNNIYTGCQMFLGGKGNEAALHNAHQANLFIQVWGEKKWVIYPSYYFPAVDPDPVRNLYRNAPFRKGPPFNPFNPDYEMYPRFEYIQGYEIHLKPGDILYNPPYVWHAVKNLTDSIACSYRWTNPFYSFKREPLYFFLDLFATNPNMYKSIKLSKENFNLVRLAEEGLLDDYLKNEKEYAGQ